VLPRLASQCLLIEPLFPGETSCLSLFWAVLDLLLAGTRGRGLSELEYREVVQMKGQH